MSNADYLGKFNNLMDMESAYNSQLNDQAIMDIVTEDKYL